MIDVPLGEYIWDERYNWHNKQNDEPHRYVVLVYVVGYEITFTTSIKFMRIKYILQAGLLFIIWSCWKKYYDLTVYVWNKYQVQPNFSLLSYFGGSCNQFCESWYLQMDVGPSEP